MSSFAPSTKKAKIASSEPTDVDYFKGIPKIEFKPDAGATDVLCFKHYNAKEVINGKTMEEWLRFSVCYWHTFRGTGADPFGFPTLTRPWEDGTNSMENAKRRLRVAFEFFSKLGVPYWTFHDRDIAPEGETLAETNANLDEITDLALELQNKTGVKLLWATCNLFAHTRYMNGAATNPDAHVFAYAAAQVKKGLEIAKKLGAENFAYKKKIGFTGQLLIEPKPKEPTKHQYDYDAQTVIGFLKTYGLDNDFKLNIEPNHTTLAGHSYEHDIVVASKYGLLGSIDSNTGSPDLGWDTDQFPMDVKNCTFVMKAVIEQNGLAPGGLNFDCKVRRESTDVEDMFIAHIGAMDAFARGLKSAMKLIEEGKLSSLVKEHYSSFDDGIGVKIEKGLTSLEELESYIMENGDPELISGKQEKCEAILNFYV
ncbi:xylose isomerase-like isoform X2 [Actinia tenebrosa]|uniref:Xylose isomerase n=1 Tax=Actinia tenebrosa TaxID=6105 RepID=A0A6P8HMM2_ACTTE|nr:xylose isomerase-like isoform X2 [Actinia tenebrosa]